MRYRLRTLLIVAALGPPLLWIGWTKYKAWQAEQEQFHDSGNASGGVLRCGRAAQRVECAVRTNEMKTAPEAPFLHDRKEISMG